jgi:uncharacterized protein
MRLLWDDEAIAHIARHGVEPWEVEEVLADPHRRKFSAYNAPSDKRMGFIGKTEDGRILVVVLSKKAKGVRPFMARDVTKAEKKTYRR